MEFCFFDGFYLIFYFLLHYIAHFFCLIKSFLCSILYFIVIELVGYIFSNSRCVFGANPNDANYEQRPAEKVQH